MISAKSRFPIVLFAPMFLAAILLGQQRIDIPDRPPSRAVGRIVALKKVLRITEDGAGLPLRSPYDLQIGEDGSIYFYDNFELLKFTSEGRFVFRIIRPGQGPGEARMRTRAAVTRDNIIVLAIAPPKFMLFDLSGKLLDEQKTEVMHTEGLFKMGGRLFAFLNEMLPAESMPPQGEVDFPTWLVEIERDLLTTTKIVSFPVTNWTYRGGMWWPRARFECALMDHNSLFVSHTAEYRIEKFDLEKNAVETIFTRKYHRVERAPGPERKKLPGEISPPALKYESDILVLLTRENELWAVTSTQDGSGNHLVDVFSPDGRYIDNFYLQFPQEPSQRPHFDLSYLALRGNVLFSVVEDEEGFRSIGKYLIPQ